MNCVIDSMSLSGRNSPFSNVRLLRAIPRVAFWLTPASWRCWNRRARSCLTELHVAIRIVWAGCLSGNVSPIDEHSCAAYVGIE